MKPILSKERIALLKTGAVMPEYLDKLRKRAEEEIQNPSPVLSFSDFKLFEETGERHKYEKPLMKKRARISLFSVMFLLTDEERWKNALEEAIFAVCGEASWVSPAHFRSGTTSAAEPDLEIDLVASETGFILAEILDLLEDKLNPRLVSFVDRAIRQKIIIPFLEKEMFWETRETNWAAVCCSGTLASILYRGTKEEAELAIPRALRALECFKKSFSEDGCCIEGPTYWNYGFGFYVYIADLLKTYTEGKIDLLSDSKSKKMAGFFQNSLLGDTFTVSFGDASEHAMGMYGVTSYLHRHCQTEMLSPQRLSYPIDETKTMQLFRDLAWYEPAEATMKKTPFVYYKEFGWYIRNNAFGSLAVNAGANWGPHQHLDVGTFILIVDDKAVFADLGRGLYTRQYFYGSRYEHFVTSSRGHNVPVIDGKYQLSGKEHRAEVIEASEKAVAFSFEKAYGEAGPEKLVRRLELSEDALVLTDSYTFDKPVGYTERFITSHLPSVDGETVRIAGCTVDYDAAQFDVTINTEEYADHAGEMKTAYCVDFSPKTDADTFVLKVKRVKK
ncbi:MAG: hypothetical protein E7390_01750 [Ruminococcaceae bacterium]|nr:hypothetical protein [Oscillospiraceae bacterium]